MKTRPEHAGPKELKRCSRCVLPETYPGIVFDENGVCNYCLDYEPPQAPLGEGKFPELIDRFRTKDSKYDCAVGLSGGRDSTFVLYYLVKELGLRVLAFTVDNGFMPEETQQNVDRAVSILGVEHIVLRHNLVRKSVPSVLSAWVRRPSAAMICQMCLGCKLGFWRAQRRISTDYGIRLCVSGYGEPGQSFATIFLTLSSSRRVRPVDLARGMSRELIRNPRYLLNPGVPYRMVVEFLSMGLMGSPRTNFVTRLVRPTWAYVSLFDYIQWDEDEIMDVITRELGWQKYHYSATPWRSDCKINLLKNALYLQTLGFSKNDDMLSDMVRQGRMTRERALERLANDNTIPEEFLIEFFHEIGVNYERAEAARQR